MRVGELPPKRMNNWFGLAKIDPNIVQDRIPKLQAWFQEALQLPAAHDFQPLHEWLGPFQIGDVRENEYQRGGV